MKKQVDTCVEALLLDWGSAVGAKAGLALTYKEDLF